MHNLVKHWQSLCSIGPICWRMNSALNPASMELLVLTQTGRQMNNIWIYVHHHNKHALYNYLIRWNSLYLMLQAYSNYVYHYSFEAVLCPLQLYMQHFCECFLFMAYYCGKLHTTFLWILVCLTDHGTFISYDIYMIAILNDYLKELVERQLYFQSSM